MSQQKMCFPKGFEVEEGWIQTKSTADPIDAPFKRQVEFWLLVIVYAIRKKIPPRHDAVLAHFATVGSTRHDVKLDSQVLELLLHVAIWDGREAITRERVPTAAEVFGTCNAYAAAGVSGLMDEFTGMGASSLDPSAVKLAKLALRLTEVG